ncbi:hypothetical protein ACNFIC_02075 [Pseudomonas sp. NY15463]|uniref:hypothetical protein n=1 Tax=Pseudomonas sp. NY15463 TaxID=3400361 RepID=UPI003A8918F6
MSCLICAGQAESIDCASGWEARCCAQCGSYRMSQALILMMMEQGQIFDTPRMRAWLASRRDQGAVPSIERSHAILMR